VAPAPAAAVVVGDRLAGLVCHEAGRVPRFLARAADLQLEPVRRPGLAARDAGHRVFPPDDVGVDSSGRGQLLAVERPETGAELARAAAVGRVVACGLALRGDALVELGCRAEQVRGTRALRAGGVAGARWAGDGGGG